MLLTRFLPPQFLLPSWTATELALAVQRSCLSSTSTQRFEIRKQTHGSKKLKVEFLGRRALRAVENEKDIKRHSLAGASDSESTSTAPRHFESHPPPRRTPIPSSAFYVGKRYGVPGAPTTSSGPPTPSGTEKLEVQESRPNPLIEVKLPENKYAIEEPSAILGRQRDDRKRRGLSSSPGMYRLTLGKGATPDSRPVAVGRAGQLTVGRHGEEVNTFSKHEKSGINSQQEKGTGSPPSKPDDVLWTEAQNQKYSTGADDLVEAPLLDMAGRWKDSTQPLPTPRSPDRLAWESDELSPATQPLTKVPLSPAVKTVQTKYRPASPEPTRPRETISLFEELFPEESKVRHEAVRRAEERLDKLPAFEWDLDDGFDRSWQADRKRKKAKLNSIPQRRDLNNPLGKTLHGNDPVTSRAQRKDPIAVVKHEPSIVILEGLSKYLEESDFFRVGPKGNHIEGWTSGILKVIPARDHTTLEPLGYYYLLFSNDAAARAYMDNTLRLHTLGQSKGPSSVPFMPPPPGALKDGENLKELLRGFSVVPRQNKLSMRLLNKPYRPGVLELIHEGGPPAMANRRAKGDALVLFSVDAGAVTYYDILYAIKDDGRHRNMHWKFAGGKDVDISNITRENKSASQDVPGDNTPHKWNRFKTPDKYIFAMKDVQEARRFVREWHRRPIEVVRRGQKEELGQERPAIVSAELLW